MIHDVFTARLWTLVQEIKINNDLYCSGDNATYKLYWNKVLTLTRIRKKMYFHKYFEENFTNTKKIWEGINSLLGRKNKAHKDIISLKCTRRNLVSQNPSAFPDIMNKYCSSIGHNLASKMPNSKPKRFTDYLPKLDVASSFFFNPVSPSEIDSEIMTIKLNKATGCIHSQCRILRSAKHIISQPLSMLINKSIEFGTYQ